MLSIFRTSLLEVHASPRDFLLVRAWRWISLHSSSLPIPNIVGYFQTDLYELIIDPHQVVRWAFAIALFDHRRPKFHKLYLMIHKSLTDLTQEKQLSDRRSLSVVLRQQHLSL